MRSGNGASHKPMRIPVKRTLHPCLLLVLVACTAAGCGRRSGGGRGFLSSEVVSRPLPFHSPAAASGITVRHFRDQNEVQRVAFSPDGTVLATAEERFLTARPAPGRPPVLQDARVVVVLRDIMSGVCTRVLQSGPLVTDIRTVVFSPDGARIATGNGNGTVTIWDTRTGVLTHTLAVSRENLVECLAFSSDGSFLVAGDGESGIQLWDLRTGKPRHAFRGLYMVSAVGISSDGRLVVGGCGVAVLGHKLPKLGELVEKGPSWETRNIGQLRVWDAQTGKLLWARDGGRQFFVTSAIFSPDGTTLITGGERLIAWDVRTGRPRWARMKRPFKTEKQREDLCLSDGHILAIALSPDGALLAALAIEKEDEVQLWNPRTGDRMRLVGSWSDGYSFPSIGVSARSISAGIVDQDLMHEDRAVTIRSWPRLEEAIKG